MELSYFEILQMVDSTMIAWSRYSNSGLVPRLRRLLPAISRVKN